MHRWVVVMQLRLPCVRGDGCWSRLGRILFETGQFGDCHLDSLDFDRRRCYLCCHVGLHSYSSVRAAALSMAFPAQLAQSMTHFPPERDDLVLPPSLLSLRASLGLVFTPSLRFSEFLPPELCRWRRSCRTTS